MCIDKLETQQIASLLLTPLLAGTSSGTYRTQVFNEQEFFSIGNFDKIRIDKITCNPNTEGILLHEWAIQWFLCETNFQVIRNNDVNVNATLSAGNLISDFSSGGIFNKNQQEFKVGKFAPSLLIETLGFTWQTFAGFPESVQFIITVYYTKF